MREIKFRAWSKTLQRLVPIWSAIETRGDNVLRPINSDFVIEQYTGIDDRVGNAVHENDIVEIDYRRGDHTVLDPQTLGMVEQYSDVDTIVRGVVHIWPSTGAIINHTSSENPEQFVGDYRIPQYLHINKDCIIIGNIHENQDLLEEL